MPRPPRRGEILMPSDRQTPDDEPFQVVRLPPRTDGALYPCPCCGYRTLPERGGYDICPVCYWEDDGQDDPVADEVWGGPNYTLSLTQARATYRAIGACEPHFTACVRLPHANEAP